jgi:hypothetical protein
MRVRIRESISPRQSPSSLILASIKREGDSLFDASFVAIVLQVLRSFLVSRRHVTQWGFGEPPPE